MSWVPVPKCYFTVFSTVENRMCKQGYHATFFGTRAIFIRAMPDVFGSVNRPLGADYMRQAGPVCRDFGVSVKAAGDKLLMNKFIRHNFGGGLTLKDIIS